MLYPANVVNQRDWKMMSVRFYLVVMVAFLLVGCAARNQFSGPER